MKREAPRRSESLHPDCDLRGMPLPFLAGDVALASSIPARKRAGIKVESFRPGPDSNPPLVFFYIHRRPPPARMEDARLIAVNESGGLLRRVLKRRRLCFCGRVSQELPPSWLPSALEKPDQRFSQDVFCAPTVRFEAADSQPFQTALVLLFDHRQKHLELSHSFHCMRNVGRHQHYVTFRCIYGIAPDRQLYISVKNLDQRIKRRRMFAQALSFIECKQGDRAGRFVDESFADY